MTRPPTRSPNPPPPNPLLPASALAGFLLFTLAYKLSKYYTPLYFKVQGGAAGGRVLQGGKKVGERWERGTGLQEWLWQAVSAPCVPACERMNE